MEDLGAYMEERRRRVESFLHSHLRNSDPRLSKLFEAMRYSLKAGGKRIRPILMFASFEAVASQPSAEAQQTVVAVAAAIEMIHTYSLIHDDLPAMDNDDLRRGQPTNHKVFGEAMAILAGDSLLTEAFRVMAAAVSSTALLEVIRDISEAAGGRGMAGGQALDLEYEKKKITPDELETLHRLKTGRLIEVSVTSGGRLAGADESELTSLRSYGQTVGLAFQIADDILDVEGVSVEMGKGTGGDARKEKATYPSILGLERSKELAQSLAREALATLDRWDPRADPLREIARFIINRRC